MAIDPLAFLDKRPSSPSISSEEADPLDFLDQPRISRTRSLLSAFPKGLIKGSAALGKLHDPIGSLFSGSLSQPEQSAVERVLPTQKGQSAENILEIAGELAPSFVVGPESAFTKAAQVGMGALAKYGLKEMGTPGWLQEVGSAATSVSPQAIKGALSKKLVPNSAQKEVYDLLKGYGFDDKTITPFIQSEKKAKWLAKTARGFLDPAKFKRETDPIGELVYGSIKQKQASLPPLSGARKISFLKQLDEKLADIPYVYTDMIKKDIQRLRASKLNFKDLRDFESALNAKVGPAEGGKAVLGQLKEPINFGERMISPSLYKEKELMNRAYKSRMDIYDRLPENIKGNLLEKAGKLGPLGALAVSYTFGLPWIAKGYALKKGSEIAATKALTSPRYQNMQLKLFRALMEGNKGALINLLSRMQDQIDRFTTHKSEQELKEQS